MSWAWVSLCAIPLALVIDRRWGEPPVWLHPVVLMGRYLGALGPWLCALPARAAWVGGMLAWCLGAGLAAACALAAELVLQVDGLILGSTVPWTAVGQTVLLALVLKPLLAWRMLRDEVAAVEQALAESLPAGRARLQRLVSREVHTLDETTVRESAIETLAENLNDSVVAPLFWFALGGLAGVAVYRFANTADAMWGYRGRYEWAGKWAARADDVLSWLPARLTAVLLMFAAGHWLPWSRLRQQARLTPSPNGGWPMGAMAMLLGVQLRKPGVYVLHGEGVKAQPAHTLQALQWAQWAVWAAAVVSMALVGGVLLLERGLT